MPSRIALIGFRATGKSRVGNLLAQKLGFQFMDMDTQLVAACGQEIDAWVRSNGWDSFRKAESELLDAQLRSDRLVLATGGGIILREKNRNQLHRHFFVVWLRASTETILCRLSGDPKTALQRPPLTGLPLREEIERVLEERLPLYEETAHLTLHTNGVSPEELVVQIEAELGRFQSDLGFSGDA